MQKRLGVGAFMATTAWPVSVKTQQKAVHTFIHHLRSLVTLFCLPGPTSHHQSVCLLLRQGFCWQSGTCSTQISSFLFVFGDLHQGGKQSQHTEGRPVLAPGQSLLLGLGQRWGLQAEGQLRGRRQPGSMVGHGSCPSEAEADKFFFLSFLAWWQPDGCLPDRALGEWFLLRWTELPWRLYEGDTYFLSGTAVNLRYKRPERFWHLDRIS